MKRRIEVRRLAELELNRAVIWYEERRLGLGVEFLAELKKSIAIIEERPQSFPIEYRDFRKALLDRFPYRIFFRVNEELIVIVGVLHSSQRISRLRGRS